MTTNRPRRGHAALGARWFSAGLAVAGTVGITSYLEVAAATSPTGPIELVGPVATTLVPVPAPPDVSVIVVPDTVDAAPAPTVTPTVPPTGSPDCAENRPAHGPAGSPTDDPRDHTRVERPMISSSTKRVMGTTATITLQGGSIAPHALFDRLDELERVWTRFRPDSELNRLNAAAGSVTIVSPALLVLVQHLVSAHRLTGGRFDPTMRDQIASLGYDRTLWTLPNDGPPVAHGTPTGRCDEITVLPDASAVLLPTGTHLDPGALGKGLAADLIADDAMKAGATGVLVDIGGDIVTRGHAPDGGPWRVEIPASGDQPHRIVELSDGAIATSDTRVRQWRRGGVEIGHILDPGSGQPIARHVVATAIAGAGWAAEAAATAAIVATSRNETWPIDGSAAALGATVYVSQPEHASA